MNQYVIDTVAKLIRQAVLTLMPLLGPKLADLLGPLTGEIVANAVPIAAWLVAFAWGHIKGRVETQKLLTAAGAAGISVSDVEAMVKDPTVSTPSVTTPKEAIPSPPTTVAS